MKSILEPISRSLLAPSWAPLGPLLDLSWEALGPLLGASWPLLASPRHPLGPSWVPFWHSKTISRVHCHSVVHKNSPRDVPGASRDVPKTLFGTILGLSRDHVGWIFGHEFGNTYAKRPHPKRTCFRPKSAHALNQVLTYTTSKIYTCQTKPEALHISKIPHKQKLTNNAIPINRGGRCLRLSRLNH